jgi:hypothetical protein
VVRYYDYRNIFSVNVLSKITIPISRAFHCVCFGRVGFRLLFYDHFLATGMLEIAHWLVIYNVPVAINVNGMYLKIKDNRKIITTLKDNRWLSKYC